MKTFLVLGGYGEMGQIIVADLLESTKDKIIVAGRDLEAAQKFIAKYFNPRLKAAAIDVSNIRKLAKLIKNCDIVINSTQYNFNLHVMRACILAKKNYIDLGGLFHMTKKQLKLHEIFKRNGLTAVLGCGATPGITNVLAAYGRRFLDKVQEIHVRFGDKDFTKTNLPFVLPYSARTIFDEFSMLSASFTKGQMKFITPWSDEEIEKFPRPVGEQICGSVLHSELATFPKSFPGLHECSFKGGFGRDFVDFVKMFINRGFIAKEPYRTWTVEFLNKFLPPPKIKVKDIEILRVKLIGLKNRHRKAITVDCIARSNSQWNSPAGTVDTAVPPSIIAQMMVKGAIKAIGVLPPEQCIPPEPFFRELRKRGMKIEVKY